MRRRHPALLGAALAVAAASPAAAATVEINADDTNTGAPVWDKTAVAIMPGDTVVWKWDDVAPPHNLWSFNDPDWSYQSEAGALSGTYTFATPGTYAFYCQIHGAGMSGTVTVGSPPPPPPPPLSEQPLPNDGGDIGALETGGLDRTEPTVKAVRLRRSTGAVRVQLSVSERSRVTVRLKRGSKIVKTKRATGVGRLRLTVGKSLRAGRYRVEITARDIAGNTSPTRAARVTIR